MHVRIILKEDKETKTRRVIDATLSADVDGIVIGMNPRERLQIQALHPDGSAIGWFQNMSDADQTQHCNEIADKVVSSGRPTIAKAPLEVVKPEDAPTPPEEPEFDGEVVEGDAV